jgi:cytochrome o ubiquinol oxidase subunit 1
VWLHHFFTMGSGASVNSFFGITTMIISIPTGAKIFNWLFTMYRGRIRFELPMMWTVGFMVTFVIGGMTGVLLAVPPADFVLHNSLFLIAHFHNVIIGGVLFGMLALPTGFPRPSATSSIRSGASARSGSGSWASGSRSCRCMCWA